MNAGDRLVVAAMTLTLAGALSLAFNAVERWLRPAPRIETTARPARLGVQVERAFTQCPKGYAKVCGDTCAKWCNRLRVIATVGNVYPNECFLALTGASAELHGMGFFSGTDTRQVERTCSDVWAWPEYEPDRHWFHTFPGPWAK